LLRYDVAGAKRLTGWTDQRPRRLAAFGIVVVQWTEPLPWPLRRALAPRVCELNAGCAAGAPKIIAVPLLSRDVVVLPDPEFAVSDPAITLDCRCFGHDNAKSTQGEFA
jgi:hypothetical protein